MALKYYGDWSTFEGELIPSIDFEGQIIAAPDVRGVDLFLDDDNFWQLAVDTPLDEDERRFILYCNKDTALKHFRTLRRAEHIFHGVRS